MRRCTGCDDVGACGIPDVDRTDHVTCPSPSVSLSFSFGPTYRLSRRIIDRFLNAVVTHLAGRPSTPLTRFRSFRFVFFLLSFILVVLLSFLDVDWFHILFQRHQSGPLFFFVPFELSPLEGCFFLASSFFFWFSTKRNVWRFFLKKWKDFSIFSFWSPPPPEE